MKARYSTFLVDKEKLATFLNNRQEEIDEEMERQRLESKQEQQREEEYLLQSSRCKSGSPTSNSGTKNLIQARYFVSCGTKEKIHSRFK